MQFFTKAIPTQQESTAGEGIMCHLTLLQEVCFNWQRNTKTPCKCCQLLSFDPHFSSTYSRKVEISETLSCKEDRELRIYSSM